MPDKTTTTLRPAHLALIVLSLLLFLPTLAALLLDRLGLALGASSTAAASLGTLALALVAAGLAMLRGRLRVDWSAWALAELAALLAVAAGAAWHLLALAGAPFLPLGISVDGGLHYALVDHLMQVRELGVKSGRLGELDAYTPGYHLLVMLGALWSGADPIYALYPVAALYLALGIAALAQLAMDGCPEGPWRPLLGLSILLALALLPSTHTIEIITTQSFYPTAAGLSWLLIVAWATALLQREQGRLAWGIFAMGTLGVIFCYPFWLPTALALFIALAVARRWGAWRQLGRELLLIVMITALGLALVHDLLGDQLVQASKRMPALSAATLALLALLAAGGLAVAWLLRGQRWLPAALLAALMLAQFVALRGRESYLGEKMLYGLPYAGLAAGAALYGALLARLRLRLPRALASAFLPLALLVALLLRSARSGPGWPAQRPFHPLSPGQVELALWARDELKADAEQIAYVVDYNITAFWLKIALLRSPRGWSASSVLNNPLPRYSHWATDPAVLRYALVDNAEEQLVGPPSRLLGERGSARLLEREPAGDSVYIQVFSIPEPFGEQLTVRSAAYASGLPSDDYRLWFLLSPRAEGDALAEELWRQPLDTGGEAAERYGLVRIDPQRSSALVWQAGQDQPAPLPELPAGTALSAWMQLRYREQPIATRRIYDLVLGDAGSLQLRDFNPNSIFSWGARPQPERALAQASHAVFGQRVALERWELEPAQLVPGNAATLSVEWRSLARVETPHRIALQLHGDDGANYPLFDGEPQEGFNPFWIWRPGTTLRDSYPLTLPPDVPPGSYRLVVAIYDPVTGAALPVAQPQGDPVPLAVLGNVRVGG